MRIYEILIEDHPPAYGLSVEEAISAWLHAYKRSEIANAWDNQSVSATTTLVTSMQVAEFTQWAEEILNQGVCIHFQDLEL